MLTNVILVVRGMVRGQTGPKISVYILLAAFSNVNGHSQE